MHRTSIRNALIADLYRISPDMLLLRLALKKYEIAQDIQPASVLALIGRDHAWLDTTQDPALLRVTSAGTGHAYLHLAEPAFHSAMLKIEAQWARLNITRDAERRQVTLANEN